MNTTQILANLKRISDESGREFLDLSTNFPVLVSELSFTKKEDGAAAQHEKLAKFSKIQTGLNEALDKQDIIIQQNNEVVKNFKNRNTQLVDSFMSRMEMLSKMNELIQIIKDESNEMELISLNAMVVSIKSGKEGQAFSNITSNLKTLSQRLNSQSDALILNEKIVQDNITQLQETTTEIERINDSTKKDVADIDGSQISEIIEQIMTSLSAMIDRAAEVKVPIINAMECIQMQDIIRQSLDDVILTLSKIKDPTFCPTMEEKLDQCCFNVQLADVSEKLLTSIKTKLKESIAVFKKNQILINEILSDVENQRLSFVGGKARTVSKAQSLKDCIDKTTEDFGKFVSIFNSYENAQEQVLEKSNAIQTSVERIQLCFNEFFPIINNLHYVAIAQRIEVARNSIIQSIESTVEYMANLIDKTNENVQDAQAILQDFIDNSTEQIHQFTSEADQDRKFFSSINRGKTSFIKNLGKLQKQFVDAVNSFTVYSKDFLSCYASIEKTIGNLGSLVSDLENEQKSIISVYDENNATKMELLRAIGKENWEIQNNSFNEFIHHFTVISDKETVSEVTGLKIEGGVEAGEITFF